MNDSVTPGKRLIPVSPQVSSGFATPIEAARFLHLSKGMIHKMVHKGEIPASHYGRAVRIPWAWLRAQAGQ